MIVMWRTVYGVGLWFAEGSGVRDGRKRCLKLAADGCTGDGLQDFDVDCPSPFDAAGVSAERFCRVVLLGGGGNELFRECFILLDANRIRC